MNKLSSENRRFPEILFCTTSTVIIACSITDTNRELRYEKRGKKKKILSKSARNFISSANPQSPSLAPRLARGLIQELEFLYFRRFAPSARRSNFEKSRRAEAQIDENSDDQKLHAVFSFIFKTTIEAPLHLETWLQCPSGSGTFFNFTARCT